MLTASANVLIQRLIERKLDLIITNVEWCLYDFVLSKIAQLDTLKLFVLTPFTDVIEIVAAAYAVTGFLVGVFGSLLSIRKFLKV